MNGEQAGSSDRTLVPCTVAMNMHVSLVHDVDHNAPSTTVVTMCRLYIHSIIR